MGEKTVHGIARVLNQRRANESNLADKTRSAQFQNEIPSTNAKEKFKIKIKIDETGSSGSRRGHLFDARATTRITWDCSGKNSRSYRGIYFTENRSAWIVFCLKNDYVR